MKLYLIIVAVLVVTTSNPSFTKAISSSEVNVSRSCTVKWHFQSHFVTPLLERKSHVTGCTSQDITRNSKEVHVIHLESAGFNSTSSFGFLPRVSLKVRPRMENSLHVGPLVVILNTVTPVMWQLEVEKISNGSRFTVSVTQESQVVSSVPLRLELQQKPTSSLRKLLNWARSHFKALTSFSTIRMANSVVLKVGIDSRSPESCEVTSEVKVDNVEASFIQSQPASGCTVLQNISPSSRDVHIVKLRSAGESDEVVIHLQPQGAPETNTPSKPIVNKDLVLILKSISAVRWRIDSWGLQGIVQVVAEHQVTPGSVPDFQFIQVRVQSLSNETEELVSEMIRAFGNISTIMETDMANRINIMIVGETMGTDHHNVQSDGGSPQGGISVGRGQSRFVQLQQSNVNTAVSQIPPSPQDKFNKEMSEFPLNLKGFSKTSTSTNSREMWNSKDKTTVTNTFLQKWQGNADANLTLELESLMALECQKNMIKITFPKSSTEDIAMRINGANIHWLELTLQDQECKAISNSTHFILKTSLENCGFSVVSDGGRYIYRNQILFWAPVEPLVNSDNYKSKSIDYDDSFSDDEDTFSPEEGSGMEHYLRQALAAHRGVAHSRLLSSQSFQCTYNFTGDGNTPKVGSHDNEYHMELFKDSTFHEMLQKKNGSAEVPARDKVYVQTTIDAGPYLYIVTDECWLSLTDNSLLDVNDREILIQHSCPKHLSVGLLRMGSSGHLETSREPTRQQGFFFQLTEKWIAKNVYLHCRLAACSEKLSIPIPGVKQCIDPNDYCVGNNIKQYLESRAGQHFSVEVAGPLLVLPPRRSNSLKGGESKIVPSSSDDSSQADKNLCVNHKVTGLSTGAVVGIAFASFIIGAGLMAILWFIHLCTDPSRRTRAQQESGVHRHHHSGYDLSGHSGSSTPSSQAPMTVQVCT